MQGCVPVTCGMSDSAYVGAQGTPGLYPANVAAEAQRRPAAPADRSSRPSMYAPVNGCIAK